MHIYFRFAAVVASGLLAMVSYAEERAADKTQTIVVTATALGESPLEVAQPASVISGDALIREVGVSLGETLDHQLGVSASYFGPTASRPVIRGLSGERVQVLEDSIGSLDVSALSEDHEVTVDPLLARQIEVIKGPATLLYGNASVGGVINVLTDRIPEEHPEESLSGAFEVRGNTAAEERSGSGRLDGGAGNFAVHLDGYKRRTENLDIPGHALSSRLRARLAETGEETTDSVGTLFGSDSDSYGGSLGASYVGDDGFVGVGWRHFDSNYGAPGAETLPDGRSVRLDMRQDRYDVKGRVDRPIGGLENVRVRFSHADYRHQEFEADGTPGTIFTQHADEGRIAFEHAPLGDWRGTAGVQYRDVRFRAAGEEAFVPANTTTIPGIFLFEERPFGPVKLELGARIENQTIKPIASAGLPKYDDNSLSTSAGALWKFMPGYSTSLNVTRSQRQPSPTELYADGPHVAVGRFEIGDPGLNRETALTADLILRKYEGPVTFNVTLFGNLYDDFIFPFATGATAGDEEPLPVVEYRQQDASFYGAEAEVILRPLVLGSDEFSLRLASDYVRGRLADRGGDVPQLPPWRAGAEVRFEREHWQSGLSAFRYAKQNKTAINELPTDGYTSLDADVGYRLAWGSGASDFFVFFKGSNLLDEDARRSTSPLKDYAPLPGRSATLGVQMTF